MPYSGTEFNHLKRAAKRLFWLQAVGVALVAYSLWDSWSTMTVAQRVRLIVIGALILVWAASALWLVARLDRGSKSADQSDHIIG